MYISAALYRIRTTAINCSAFNVLNQVLLLCIRI